GTCRRLVARLDQILVGRERLPFPCGRLLVGRTDRGKETLFRRRGQVRLPQSWRLGPRRHRVRSGQVGELGRARLLDRQLGRREGWAVMGGGEVGSAVRRVRKLCPMWLFGDCWIGGRSMSSLLSVNCRLLRQRRRRGRLLGFLLLSRRRRRGSLHLAAAQ